MKTLLKIMILLSGLLAGQDSEVNQATKDAIRAVVRYEAFSPAKLQSAEAAITEYRWRANYEIEENWNKIASRLDAKRKNIPEYVDWLFSFGTLWKTTKEGTKILLNGKSEEEKKADFMAKKYEEMVISNDEIKEMIESFNDEAEFSIEKNVSDLANSLTKNPDWGYEVVYQDDLPEKGGNAIPKVEINWEDLKSEVIQFHAIDLVGIDLTLFAGGFLTTVAVDAIYAYLWGQSLGYIGTIAANLGLISAPTVFGTMGGPIWFGVGISLSIAGGWIYFNYAEDKIVEKLQHDFANIRTNLEDGDWVYRTKTDYHWMPGILPVINLTNTGSFNQYIEQVNHWNPNHTPLMPIPFESTIRESIKPLVVKSNINYHEGIYTFNIFDEVHQNEFKEAIEYFPLVDFTEVVFYCLEEHYVKSDKSLIVMEDKLLIDWGGWHDQTEVKFLDLFNIKIKKQTISIDETTIFEGSESATKELATLLKNIIELRTQ